MADILTLRVNPVEVCLSCLALVEADAKEDSAVPRGTPQIIAAKDEIFEIGRGAGESTNLSSQYCESACGSKSPR